jgi:hypothetical protein
LKFIKVVETFLSKQETWLCYLPEQHVIIMITNYYVWGPYKLFYNKKEIWKFCYLKYLFKLFT